MCIDQKKASEISSLFQNVSNKQTQSLKMIIPPKIIRRAKLLIILFPNSTTMITIKKTLEKLMKFQKRKKHNKKNKMKMMKKIKNRKSMRLNFTKSIIK